MGIRLSAAILALAACGGGGMDVASPGQGESAEEQRLGALREVAAALPWRDRDGGLLGARYVAGFDKGPGGLPLMRIFAGDPAVACAANSNLNYIVARNEMGKPFMFSGSKDVRPELQRLMVETYREQFVGLEFALTTDPWRANLFAFETTIVPNPRHSRPTRADNRYCAYTMILNSVPAVSIMALNTGGHNRFSEALAAGELAWVRGTLLNEMMNALGTRDLQDVDFEALSYSTRLWGAKLERDQGNGAMDLYTITDSSGTEAGSKLLEMDLMVLGLILEEAGKVDRGGGEDDG
jgi:hypothetical protein